MKRKSAVSGTTIMAVVAVVACSDKDAKATIAVEVVTQVDTTAGMTDGETEDAGAVSDSRIVTESQSSEPASQEAALLGGAEDASYAGVELEQSETKPLAERVQKAVADKNMEVLAGLCVYPVYISLGERQGEEIADGSVFLKTDTGQVFTESLLKEIADTDVDTLGQFGVGVIMGKENSIISNNVDGQITTTGISLNQSMSEHVTSGHTAKKDKISH